MTVRRTKNQNPKLSNAAGLPCSASEMSSDKPLRNTFCIVPQPAAENAMTNAALFLASALGASVAASPSGASIFE